MIYQYNFLGLGYLKSTNIYTHNQKSDNLTINSLSTDKTSIASAILSSDDLEEVRSKKWHHTGNINYKDNKFDKEMNDAFGDEISQPTFHSKST